MLFVLFLAVLLLCAWPLGKYMARVFNYEKTCGERFFAPLENIFYKMAKVDPRAEMPWKEYCLNLIIFNALGMLSLFVLQLTQAFLPLNPQQLPNVETWHLAFNTAASFMTNTNWQAYSGETTLSYLTQMLGLTVQNFLSAATGAAVAIALIRGLVRKNTGELGNFWADIIRCTTRILLPICVVATLLLVSQGVIQNLNPYVDVQTVEGAQQTIAMGPVASQEAIKELGTNGGGYFGVNSSHPLENPTYLSNMVECWSILIIPMAMVFALGFYSNRKKLAYSIFGVMLFAYLAGVGINVYQEMNGNPRIDELGIAQDGGAMEGKEVRLGAAATALWSITTTVTSNGSVNGMHDSTMPLSGLMEMLNMQINTWFGGVGVGWMNYYTFIIIAVFISGLMVGRTPEFLGKKVEAREMKIATVVALLHPFVILVGTALSTYLFAHHPDFVASEGGWLNNPGFHGLSEQLYEFTSCAANNGSGFEGLGDNTYFWNYACGWVLILSRFIPIIGQVAIAGLLAQKKFIPESAGTLKTDTVTFAVMTFAVIFIVAALSFFPVHALSTIAEHFSL